VPVRLPIAVKFFLTYFLITGTALAFAGIAGYLQFKRYAVDEADVSLQRQARLVSEMFRPLLSAPKPDRGRIAALGDSIGKDLDTRVTVILPDGTVAADSAVGSKGVGALENHADHPEVRDALSGGTGVSFRRSISVRREQRYCALPVVSDGRIVGVARAAVPVTFLNARLARVRTITWGTGIAAFLLMIAGTAFLARRVTGPIDEIRAAAEDLASGDLRRRVRVRTGDELETMAASLNRTASRLEGTIGRLDEEKARLSTLIDNLSEGVVLVAADRTVRMMNRDAARLLGLSAPLKEGEPYGRATRHPEILRFIDARRRGESLPPADVFVHLPAGDRIVRLAATAVRRGTGEEPDLLVTLRDVTDEVSLSRVKSDFVSNASHELKTPLTNIRGYLEAAQDALREGAPVDPSFLAVAHANAIRMERLIDDLLELSRAESGGAPLAIEDARLAAFIDRVAALHRHAAEKAGKTLSVRVEDAPLTADVRQLTLALSNLVDNAIKHGIDRGKIALSGRPEGEAVVIEVSDDGPGIPAEHLPRIFERFYRVDKGRSRELGGTGLGLAIARHVVDAHGGTIRAESRVGVGTRIVMRIPAKRPIPG
jgi:two-component system phosphate regulon sensor histidine kinase PhoR